MSAPELVPQKVKVTRGRSFTAVDLASLAALAVLIRALWYGVKMIDIVFPFNMSLLTFTYSLGCSACLVIVRKSGTVILFTIAWMLINFFLQGELALFWIYVQGYWLISEAYYWVKLKQGADPQKLFTDPKSNFIGSFFYGWSGYWVLQIAYKYLYMVPIPMNLVLTVGALSILTAAVGSVTGRALGMKLKDLLRY